jgi:sortase (surface protein transpeptidase)
MSRGTDNSTPRHARRRVHRRTRVAGFAALGSVGLVAAGLGATGLLDSVHTQKAVQSFSAVAGSSTATASPTSSAAATTPTPQRAVPASLSIPAISLHTTLQQLGLNASGALNPPTNTTQAGWYTGSSLPGQPGPTVLAGHVDTYQGPAVFYRLYDLSPGDTVTVTLSNGQSVEYVVNEVQLYSKDDFPTAEVYGARPDPELRLITCGGTFDYTTRSYLDNVVVYATLASHTQ